MALRHMSPTDHWLVDPAKLVYELLMKLSTRQFLQISIVIKIPIVICILFGTAPEDPQMQ